MDTFLTIEKASIANLLLRQATLQKPSAGPIKNLKQLITPVDDVLSIVMEQHRQLDLYRAKYGELEE